MTRFGWIVTATALALIVFIAVGVYFVTSHTPKTTVAPTVSTTATTPTDPSALAIYTSGEYGFTFFYPASAEVRDSFSATSTEGYSWRENAVATGTAIVRISLSNGSIQIGNSSNEREVTACTKAGPAEKSIGAHMIGSTTWSAFTFQDLGTENEENVTSYRTLHNNSCYALETFEPKTAIASTTAFGLNDIVQSFSFAQ